MTQKIRLCVILVAGLSAAGMAYGDGPDAGKPGATPQITSANQISGSNLDILYSDGSHEIIPKDKRGSYEDQEPINQDELFSDIKVSADKHWIGWVPQYMICTQSWPCTPELVIYRRGEQPKFIEPDGIVWQWTFLPDNKRVVIHAGPTHGDMTGVYQLFDIESQKQLGYFTRHTDKGEAPDWVKVLQAQEPPGRYDDDDDGE